MRPTLCLIKREFTAYFLSPIAYVVLAVFLGVTGYLFHITYGLLTDNGPRGVEYPMSTMLGDGYFWLVFLFIPPLLTMRLFAEERGTGTLEMLMTAPVRDWQLVFAKYVACYGFYLLMWLPTIAYFPILMDLNAKWDFSKWTPYGITFTAGLAIAILGLIFLPTNRSGTGFLAMIFGTLIAIGGGWLHFNKDTTHLVTLTAGIDPWPVLTSYIGVFVVGAMFLSLGIFISSLVKSQMVAALISMAIGLPFIFVIKVLPAIDEAGVLYKILSFFAIPLHFGRDFSRGIIDSRHLVLYLSAALLFLFLTVRSVESRRWR